MQLDFRTQDPLVLEQYRKPNFEIESGSGDSNEVAVYFSSNDVYFPNHIDAFRKSVLVGNRFEFKRNRLERAKKHIFVRDIFKQWYVEGINRELCSVESLARFLEGETAGMDVVTIGSSAGGYAALLFGSLLRAKRILAFSGQVDLGFLLATSTEVNDPLIFKHAGDPVARKYYDLSPWISGSDVPVYYFAPGLCEEDALQIEAASRLPNIRVFRFHTDRHGIPFHSLNLADIVNMSGAALDALHSKFGKAPIGRTAFSIRVSGVPRTVAHFARLLLKKLASR